VSKQIDKLLLLPGAKGWEIWKSSQEGPFQLVQDTQTVVASAISGIPAGHLTMFFPVKAFQALPFRAISTDEGLFAELATMHAERLGVKADPMGGQLSDLFKISQDAETSTLLTVVLKTPSEGELPSKGPKEFDLSPRAYDVVGDSLILWQEFGRWVFAIYQEGKLLYSQATSSHLESPDDSVVREIRLAMGQLGIQGLNVRPASVQVWTSTGTAGALEKAFNLPVHVSERPQPQLPDPVSKLLPADVRAARREAKLRQQKIAAIAAVALIYIGLAGWYGYGLWQTHRNIKKLKADAEAIAPAAEQAAYAQHLSKWSELAAVVDGNKYPMELMLRVHKCVPPNSGLRLKTAELGDGQIKLVGEAPQAAPINQFSLSLARNSSGLSDFKWETPPPSNSSKGWDFVYSAAIPKETP
jgi:hypothetical protein